MTLDLRHVESFVAVTETGSFSAAADRLGTVQSAVSAHIRALEERVGMRLLDRGRGRSVGLAPDGHAFLTQAHRILALADEMTQPALGGAHAPTLRLGTTVTFALSTVPTALAAHREAGRVIDVSVKTARSHELLALLDESVVDLVLVFDQGRRQGRHGTVSVPLVWAAAEGFEPSRDAPLPVVFLADARDLRRHAVTALDGIGRSAQILTQPDAVGLRAMVLAGLAATVLPAPAVAAPLREVGGGLGLPALVSLPISVYGKAHAGDEQAAFADALLGALAAA